MLLKRVCFILFSVFLVGSIVTYLWAHCHDDSSCENLTTDLILGKQWDQPNDNEVEYVVNTTTYNDRPNLLTDVDYAASYWHRIEFNGEIVAFGLVRNGQTTTTWDPFVRDDHNVVGWGELDWNNHRKVTGAARIWSNSSTGEIYEIDTKINYYAPFDTHGNVDDDEYCIRNTATHEFGHWIALKDLKPKPNNTHCADYERYTMWQPGAIGSHDKETLECEDKWGAMHVYGTSGD